MMCAPEIGWSWYIVDFSEKCRLSEEGLNEETQNVHRN